MRWYKDFPGSKFDQALDPPEYPERYLPVSDAPFAAILRAVGDWLEGEPVQAHLEAEMLDALSTAGCEDVELTESEWEAHARAILEQTQEG